MYVGGPVSPASVVALGDFDDPERGRHAPGGLAGHARPGRAESLSLQRLRVYAGYAGWSPGQLDNELGEGAWIVEPAEVEDPFTEGDIWSEALRRKGGEYSLLATMPGDPSGTDWSGARPKTWLRCSPDHRSGSAPRRRSGCAPPSSR